MKVYVNIIIHKGVLYHVRGYVDKQIADDELTAMRKDYPSEEAVIPLVATDDVQQVELEV